MELINSGTKILCFSPHPDDIEFGLGATLSKYKGAYEGMLVIFSDRSATRGEVNNERDQIRAAETMEIPRENVKFIDQLGLNIDRLPIRFFATEENRDRIRRVCTEVIRVFNPDLVFVPSVHENMQDHQAIGEEVTRISRGRASVFGYEVPKHNRLFQPNVFVDVEENHLEEKVAALACYSEFTTRYYFEGDVIKSLARVRALDAGYLGFAEAFELYRLYVAP